MNFSTAHWIVVFWIVVFGGIGLFLVTRGVSTPQLNSTQPAINRIDLLGCEGKILGTFYFFEDDQENERGWIHENHVRFIDYRGRKIQFSGNYLITPIPDTVSN